ncbi:MAG: hypothetical protein JJU02_16090, partial [Cryomorphaceae bacterium]|nr:hypothetical protein [Cryomorphaceae bacterium]
YYTADVIKVTDYYPFGWGMPGRRYNQGDYRYGFNTQEKVDEVKGSGNHYTAEFWEYDPRAVQRWNMDPKAHPGFSPYDIMRGNPILFSDHAGDSVRGTTPQARAEMEKYGEKYIEKKGKKKKNPNYEPAFGEIYNEWKENDNIIVDFTTISGKDYGGTIEYKGMNEDGYEVYTIYWDPSQTEQLGASGIFEETFHLMEAMEGKEMEFVGPENGVKNLDIYDEVRAKQWVANNIKSMSPTFIINSQKERGYTHYGYIRKLNNVEIIAEALLNGVELQTPLPPLYGSNPSSVGSKETYKPTNFGGKYSRFSRTPKP